MISQKLAPLPAPHLKISLPRTNFMMLLFRLVLILAMLWPFSLQASEFIEPDSELSAQEVVEIQLLGLQGRGHGQARWYRTGLAFCPSR